LQIPHDLFPLNLHIGRFSYLLGSNRLLAGFVEFFNGLLVVTQILLAANEDDRETAAEMKNFGDPLYFGTCQRFLISRLKGEG